MVKKTENKRTWLKTGMYLGAGIAIGYGFAPAYFGMLAAAAVPEISVPFVGGMLTEAVKVQTMTRAYNSAMTVAPVVSVVASETLKTTVDHIYSCCTSDEDIEDSPKEALKS